MLVGYLFVEVSREVTSLCNQLLACVKMESGESIRTTLTVPTVGPGLGAQRAERVVKLEK
jgi:hypothetical protein